MQTKLADFGLARRITLSAATMGGTKLHAIHGIWWIFDVFFLVQSMVKKIETILDFLINMEFHWMSSLVCLWLSSRHLALGCAGTFKWQSRTVVPWRRRAVDKHGFSFTSNMHIWGRSWIFKRFWSTAQVDDFDLLSLKNLMSNTKDKCWHLQLGSIDVFHYYHSTTLFRSLWLSFGWFGDGAPERRFFISWSIFFGGWGLCKAWKTLLKNHVWTCADDGFDGEWRCGCYIRKTKSLLFPVFITLYWRINYPGSFFLYGRITCFDDGSTAKAFRKPNAKRQFNMAPLHSDDVCISVLFDLHNMTWKI